MHGMQKTILEKGESVQWPLNPPHSFRAVLLHLYTNLGQYIFSKLKKPEFTTVMTKADQDLRPLKYPLEKWSLDSSFRGWAQETEPNRAGDQTREVI